MATPSCSRQECTLSVVDTAKLKSELQPAMLAVGGALLADIKKSNSKVRGMSNNV